MATLDIGVIPFNYVERVGPGRSPKSECLAEEDDNSVISGVTEASIEDDDEEEVEDHDLADGTTVLKGADGTLYNAESFDVLGKWNESDNTLISA